MPLYYVKSIVMRKGANPPIKIRKRWAINPKTKVKEKKALYNRAKIKRELGRI